MSDRQTRFALLVPLRTSRWFTSLWVGQSLSRFGDAILMVVLPMLIYSLSHSPMTMGLLMTFYMLPQVLLLPFAGYVADRFARIPLLLITDAVRFVLLLAVTFIYGRHAVSMGIINAFAIVMGMMDALFQPTYSAVRAQVFTPDIRNAANSLTQLSQQLANLIGPSLGGLLIGVFSMTAGFAVDAITFLISLFSLLFLRGLPKVQRTQSAENVHPVRHFLSELAGGYRELRKHGWLWTTILAFSFINITFGGMYSVLIPWLIKVHLGYKAYVYGVLMSASGIGALLAGIAFGSRKTWRKRGLLAYGATGLAGLALVGIAFTTWIPGLIVLMALTGVGMMIFGLIWEGSLQELVSEDAYGRVSSLDLFGSFALLPVGYVLTGWLANQYGGQTIMMYESLAMVLVVGIALLRPEIRTFD